MPSNKLILVVALLAALAGAAASLYFEPTIAQRLAGTESGQRVLGAVLDAKAPAPPAGVIVAKRGDIVPAMSLPTIDGVQTEIPKTWAGKTTLVNVWASWCAPCLKEMPELQAFADEQSATVKTVFAVEHAANGTQVVGIALDDANSARAMLGRLEITYANLVDAPGPADASVRLGNPAGVLPYSVLVSADGLVLKTKIGPFEDKADIAAWARH